MGFWKGLRWGLFLGVVAAWVGRMVSGEDSKDNWEQAKIAGDIAAARVEVEQREKFERTRRGDDS